MSDKISMFTILNSAIKINTKLLNINKVVQGRKVIEFSIYIFQYL